MKCGLIYKIKGRMTLPFLYVVKHIGWRFYFCGFCVLLQKLTNNYAIMKKILFLLAIFSSLNCFSQIEIREEVPILDLSKINPKTEKKFLFNGDKFVDADDASKDYLVYEFPDKSASDLKSRLISSLSSIFNSPKDVVNVIGNDLIQVEGYASKLYSTPIGDDYYARDLLYNMTIRIKDGKVRYDSPRIKTIYTEWPLGGVVPLDMSLPLSELIKYPSERYKINEHFKLLIANINKGILSADDW